MQLDRRIFVKGYILVETGLLIGGVDAGQGMNGADKVVLRNPITERPYIPGSSLKGKMRSLVEQLTNDEKVLKIIDQLFGTSGDDKTENPRRLVVRDAQLFNFKELESYENLDLQYTEFKTELTIDRISAKATPHCYERVPAGAIFEFEVILSAFEANGVNDDPKEFLNLLYTAMLLLQDDCLGANGSRGYGKIKFNINSVKTRDRAGYLENKEMSDFTEVVIPAELK